jgi:hypothetical protein
VAQDQERRGQLTLELDCTAHHVTGQSFAPAPNGAAGGLFSCSVGPLPDETLAALDEAARTHAPVCLLFNQTPLVLEAVTLERKEAHRVRIVGSVAGAGKATA